MIIRKDATFNGMQNRSFIPRGAASFHVNYEGPPHDVYFLLLPKLTLLAFTSALEPLRIANQVSGKELYRWHLMTEEGTPVRCSCGVLITPDTALQDIPRGAAAFVCAGVEPNETHSARTITWLSKQHAFGCRVGGICTGAFALARAGLLKGRRFTLHWENQPAFVEIFHDLPPTGALYENDNGLITCGGGSAATDMMLNQIECDHGPGLATIVSDMCLHSRGLRSEAPQKSIYSQALNSQNTRLIAAMEYMHEALECPLEIQDIAIKVGISKRQLERLFRRYTGITPAQLYLELRIARAHALLNETGMSIAEIAIATGFATTSQFSARFRKRFGTPPSIHRRI